MCPRRACDSLLVAVQCQLRTGIQRTQITFPILRKVALAAVIDKNLIFKEGLIPDPRTLWSLSTRLKGIMKVVLAEVIYFSHVAIKSRKSGATSKRFALTLASITILGRVTFLLAVTAVCIVALLCGKGNVVTVEGSMAWSRTRDLS